MIIEATIAGLTIAIAGMTLAVVQLSRRHHAVLDELKQTREDVAHLQADLAALCKSSVGAGNHVVKLEHQVNRLLERQTQTEMRTSTDRPYSAAIQLVQQGANAEELIEKCGLTRGEADLIAMLHGSVAKAS